MAKEPNKDSKKEKLTKKERSVQTKKERKAAFLALKKQVLQFENSNFTHLVFIRQEGASFWQAGGHSAVFMSARIANRLKKPFPLHEDTDYGVKSKQGVVYIHSMGALREQLKGEGGFCPP